MGTIIKRGERYQVKIRKKGYDPVSGTFRTRREAEAWMIEQEAAMNAGTFNPALARLAAAERGVMVLLYRPLSGHELLANLNGERNSQLKWDARLFGVGAQILRTLKVGKMQLLASPRKIPSMAGFGLEITGYVDKL